MRWSRGGGATLATLAALLIALQAVGALEQQAESRSFETSADLARAISRLRYENRALQPKSAQCAALSDEIEHNALFRSLLADDANNLRPPTSDSPRAQILAAARDLLASRSSSQSNSQLALLVAYLDECIDALRLVEASRPAVASTQAPARGREAEPEVEPPIGLRPLEQTEPKPKPVDVEQLVRAATLKLSVEKQKLSVELIRLQARMDERVEELEQQLRSARAANEANRAEMANLRQDKTAAGASSAQLASCQQRVQQLQGELTGRAAEFERQLRVARATSATREAQLLLLAGGEQAGCSEEQRKQAADWKRCTGELNKCLLTLAEARETHDYRAKYAACAQELARHRQARSGPAVQRVYYQTW